MGMRGIGGGNKGNQGENKKYEIKIKRNVRIYKNIALTLCYGQGSSI